MRRPSNQLRRFPQLFPPNRSRCARKQTPNQIYCLTLALPFASFEVQDDAQTVSLVFKFLSGLPSYLTLFAYLTSLVLMAALFARARGFFQQRR